MARLQAAARQQGEAGATYEERECLLELGDLLLSKRIGLEHPVSDAQWGVDGDAGGCI